MIHRNKNGLLNNVYRRKSKFRDGCQLSGHSHGFLSKLETFKSIGSSLWISMAHKTPSYDAKMLLKDVFDKLALVKFQINNNFTQNIDETHSKQPKIHKEIQSSLWILKISRKKSRTTNLETFANPNVCDFQKKFKNL
jgi:hypothetical protein